MTDCRRCAACGEPSAGDCLRKGSFHYRICAECGNASLEPLPSEAEARELYQREYFECGHHAGYVDYAADEGLHRKNARHRLHVLRRAGAEQGALADVGCALGYFLDEARRAGWDALGVDVSEWARDRARTMFLLDVRATLADLAADREGMLDAVTFYQVLEHMVRPDQELTTARRCLRQGGVVAIETWDRTSLAARMFGGEWQQVSPPSVVHLFSRAALHRLLERSGFQIVSFQRTSKIVSTGAVACQLRSKYPRLMAAVGALLESKALRGVPIRYGLGDLVTVTAKAA